MTLGTHAKKSSQGVIEGHSGTQYAIFFKREKGPKLRWVRSVSFYLGESGKAQTRFRVRLYQQDNQTQIPGQDLLFENVVVSSPFGGQ